MQTSTNLGENLILIMSYSWTDDKYSKRIITSREKEQQFIFFYLLRESFLAERHYYVIM